MYKINTLRSYLVAGFEATGLLGSTARVRGMN